MCPRWKIGISTSMSEGPLCIFLVPKAISSPWIVYLSESFHHLSPSSSGQEEAPSILQRPTSPNLIKFTFYNSLKSITSSLSTPSHYLSWGHHQLWLKDPINNTSSKADLSWDKDEHEETWEECELLFAWLLLFKTNLKVENYLSTWNI